jgi:hypothetical protein
MLTHTKIPPPTKPINKPTLTPPPPQKKQKHTQDFDDELARALETNYYRCEKALRYETNNAKYCGHRFVVLCVCVCSVCCVCWGVAFWAWVCVNMRIDQKGAALLSFFTSHQRKPQKTPTQTPQKNTNTTHPPAYRPHNPHQTQNPVKTQPTLTIPPPIPSTPPPPKKNTTTDRLALRQVLELHEPQYLEELRAKRTELAVGFCNFPKARDGWGRTDDGVVDGWVVVGVLMMGGREA